MSLEKQDAPKGNERTDSSVKPANTQNGKTDVKPTEDFASRAPQTPPVIEMKPDAEKKVDEKNVDSKEYMSTDKKGHNDPSKEQRI